jgi:hypothetical protein
MADTNDGTTEADVRRRRMSALRAMSQDPGPRARAEALDAFGNEHELLLAAHQRWQVHLLARLDEVLEQGDGDVHDDVLLEVERLTRLLPGLAALLRDSANDPVLAPARHRLSRYVEQACPCGRPHPLVGAAPRARSASRCPVLHACAAAAGWAVGTLAQHGHTGTLSALVRAA